MLSRIKMDYPEIRRALLEIDDETLSIDDLKAISKQLPTSEEVQRIQNFDEIGKLAKADQYFSQIITIPRLSERLECMLYRRKLDLDIEEIRPDLNTLRNASQELRTSSKFKQILQVSLAVGNALNGSTFRGGARGFQLESLLKMKETKTARGGPECPTLLHYLAKVLMRKDPSLTTFIEELPSLEAAARVSVQTTTQSVNALVSGLDQLKVELRESRDLPSNDRFIQIMRPYVEQVGPIVGALKNMGIAIEVELKALLKYYGEDPNSPEAPKPEDFFGLVASFSSSLQKCALEVHDAEAKVMKIVSKPSTPKIKPAVSAGTVVASQDPPSTQTSHSTLKPPSQGYAAGKRSVGRGDLDQAIRSMREGKRRNRPRPLSKIFLDGANAGGRPQSRLFDS